MIRFHILLALGCWLSTAALYGQTQTVGLFLNNTAKVSSGYILMAPLQNGSTYLIDNNGQLVNSWSGSSAPNQMAYLLPDGHLLRAESVPGGGGNKGGGQISEYDWQSNLVWRYQYPTSDLLLHHDLKKLPNGNVIAIVMENKTQADALAAGFRPEVLPNGIIQPDAVIEIQPTLPSGGQVVWEWHAWDHLVQSYDSTKSNYGVPSTHPELVDPNAAYPQKIAPDWNHMNGIDYNATLDQMVLSVRNNSEVWVIDHSTTAGEATGHTGGKYGKGGDLLFRWGNPQMYGAGTKSNQILYQQHDAQWIPAGRPGAGNLMVFNNGINRTGGNYSSADEFGTPVDSNGNYPLATGAAWAPAQLTWTHFGTGAEQFYETTIGGVERQPNGNTIVCWGAFGVIEEFTSAGEMVWKYVNPVQASATALTQGQPPDVDPNSSGDYMNRVFKVRKYAPDYPGLAGHDLTPKGPLEKYAASYVNAASLTAGLAAPGAVLSVFGKDMSSDTAASSSATLPTTLAGVTVQVTDGAGVSQSCPLFYVSPTQINLLVPAGVAAATFTIQNGSSSIWTKGAIGSVAPGLFAANANGKGVGAIGAVRVDAAGQQTGVSVSSYNASSKQYVAVPIGLGAATDQVYLSLFGTGIRGASSLSKVAVTIGGVAVPVQATGAQPEFPGLDQVNVGPLPQSLAGKGSCNVGLTVDGMTANIVTVSIQ